jgi:hypothetical protein
VIFREKSEHLENLEAKAHQDRREQLEHQVIIVTKF